MSIFDRHTPEPSLIGGERGILRIYLLVRVLASIPAAAYVLRDPHEAGAAFWIVFAVTVLGGLTALALASSDVWSRLRPEHTLIPDVIALTALIALSGGAQSGLRHVVLALMIAPAILMAPRFVAYTGAGLLVGYAASAVPDLLRDEPGAPGTVIAYVLGLAWATGAALVLSAVRVRAFRQVEALTDGRQLLLGAVLDAEARDRGKITAELHEGALQLLLTARQELDEIPTVDEAQRAAVARADAGMQASVAALRHTIAELHPVALDHAGLEAALRALVHRAGDRHGLEVRVEIAAEAEGVRDELIVNVARELVSNVVEHAGARTLAVRVEHAAGRVIMEVKDDGVGFDPHIRRADAMGLAACAERVAAAHGSFAVASSPGGGTRVRVELGPPDVPANGALTSRRVRLVTPPSSSF